MNHQFDFDLGQLVIAIFIMLGSIGIGSAIRSSADRIAAAIKNSRGKER